MNLLRIPVVSFWKKDQRPLLPIHLFCHFSTPSLPVSLRMGYLNPYIPISFKCFQYGHHKNNCKNSSVWAKCGHSYQNSKVCKADASSVNCKGSHNYFSKECDECYAENEIQRITTLQRLFYPEARKTIQDSSAIPPVLHLTHK